MDGLARTEADLATLFQVALNRQIGTSKPSFERQAFVRRMSRKLAKHFDATGWPETNEDVQTYVAEAIERYC